MNNKQLSDALNYIDDNIIESADTLRQVNKKHKIVRITRSCVAACLVIAITATGIIFFQKLKENNTTAPNTSSPNVSASVPNTDNLPQFEISQNFGDMGFESYMVHDISELKNANPWSEDCDIKTLPVYNNSLNLNERFEITNIDKEKMTSLILEVAKLFGLKESEFEITTDSKAYTDRLFVKTDKFEIRVDPQLTATIEFTPSISLPQNYNFSHFANYDEKFAIAEYFKDQYKNIINFKSPKIDINGGDYNIHDQQMYHIQFFDVSGDITQDIINYNFNTVSFACDDNGKLWLIRISKPDLSQKIGDYPIITKEQATELLSNGGYSTSVPSNYKIKIENIKKVELVYRNIYWMDKIYMPYYKFYIELPELENRNGNGEKHYGIYYVPAIKGQFIKNLPVPEIHFN